MSIHEMWRLLRYILMYLGTEPLSHRKRDLLIEVLMELVDKVEPPNITHGGDPSDIPF